MRLWLASTLCILMSSAAAQTILLTYRTFDITVRRLEGYMVHSVSGDNEAYEAILSDAAGNNYLLAVKELEQCQPYMGTGKKLSLADREAFLFEHTSIASLSVPLPELMACLQLTTAASDAEAKLCALATSLPFVVAEHGQNLWPERIPEKCRVPGTLRWTRKESTKTEGFSVKIVAEIEATVDTFNWSQVLSCECVDRNEFAECGSFVLFWQDGRIRDIPSRTRIGERLKFTYYFK
ncbi:MAG: hypothetical protein IPM52_14190 [Bacteroidetes bacterium]|nr:hypothetical protein [Bacteroidota bacterium]